MGHEEEIGTNNFCLVELDPLLRISNMGLASFHSFILTSIYCIAVIMIYLCI